jgi:hypothetical protein
MQTKLLNMLPFIKEKAQLNYEETGRLVPVLFLNTKDKGVLILGIVAEDFADAKEQIGQMLRKLIAEENLYEYSFLSEAWAAKCQDISLINKWLESHGTLEGFPGYGEVISLNYASPSLEIIATASIENKKVMTWDDLKQTPVDAMKAQMSGGCRLSGLWAEHAVQTN